ncbi:hypothetical protein DEO72_LG4g1217 [Vigna unguiculata]|uniref:Uncharacterized protein n=1 Tax=Vigna unguiculata TaxID=3917 RepID=A0A4D6LN42_VIGUN|nr:hypothetical protein DEO72_LG4g1217 [Vigna unguiculata]
MVARKTCSDSSGSARLLDSAAVMVVGRRRRSRSGAENLLDGAGNAAAVRCRQRNDGLERQRCAGWWEVCVGVVRDGGSCAGFARSCAGRRRRRRLVEVRRCTM